MSATDSDQLFQALAHQARRQMMDLLQEAPGLTVAALASHFDISRIAVMKHLKVLETANLVLSKKSGRERHLFFNPVPIQMVYDRWTNKYSAFWSARLVDLKQRIETQNQGSQRA
jgi:predicted transcriptional regulator